MSVIVRASRPRDLEALYEMAKLAGRVRVALGLPDAPSVGRLVESLRTTLYA